MPSYLYAVQDDQGRELISEHVDVEKVSDVEARFAHRGDQDVVQLHFDGIVLKEADVDGGEVLSLCRWPSHDKTATAVCRPIK